VGSPSHTSMDVHVGSSPPHSGCMVIAQAFGQGVALEASALDDRVLGSADDTELVPADSLRVAPVDDPSPSHQLISHDLGGPLILLQPPGILVSSGLTLPRRIIILMLVCF
jgi:hypothetical protein